MTHVYNFSAGPAVLPKSVLQRASDEMLDWHGSGMSVMEMSHRGKEFISIAEKAEHDLRDLIGIPKNYKVLFLQGGASSQFAMVRYLEDGTIDPTFGSGGTVLTAIGPNEDLCNAMALYPNDGQYIVLVGESVNVLNTSTNFLRESITCCWVGF